MPGSPETQTGPFVRLDTNGYTLSVAENQTSTYEWIDSDRSLDAYRKLLRDEKVKTVAMDFEAEYNLHHYGERLCLIQIYDGNRFALVDAPAITDDPLVEFLEDRQVLKLFFDVGSDAALVKKQYDAEIGSVLDLRLVADAVGDKPGGLSKVLETHLGIASTAKKEAFQRYDWTRRPIEPDAIEYALQDVRYLFQLKDALLADVANAGLVESLASAIARTMVYSVNKRRPNRRMNAIRRQLSAQQLRLYEAIDRVREGVAMIVDRPKDQVIRNDDVLRLAKGEKTAKNCQFGRAVPGDLRPILEKEIARAIRK